MIFVVDDQHHPPIAKKNTHLMSRLHRRRWRKIQDMILPAILDGFIMVLMRRIEEEEVISGCCIVSSRGGKLILLEFDTGKNSQTQLDGSSYHIIRCQYDELISE